MKLKYFVLLMMVVGMVGCEKESKVEKVEVKRVTLKELEANAAKMNNNPQQQDDAKK